MIGVFLLLLAAKGPVPPVVYCEGDQQIVHLPYADIAVGATATTLRDAKAPPKPAKAESQASKSFDVKGTDSVLTIRPDGWNVMKGEAATPVTPPKGALGAEARLYGVVNGQAWIAGQYWIARVNLATGEVVSGKLLRDGRTVFVLDVGDSVLFASSDRITRCGADAVCSEIGRVPFAIARVAIGQTAYLFASDASTDKIARVAKDKLETATPVETGTSAVVCQAGPSAMAFYIPGTTWTVTRVPADVVAVAPVAERRERLLASALAAGPTIPANAALFDTALREKWPELEAFGLIATKDARPEIRAHVASAFATVPSTRGFATLWLLGRDADANVRSSALDATARWCSKQRVVPCTSALKHYMADPNTEVSWLARDHLLVYDPLSALRDANVDYKRDAISHLAHLMTTNANPAIKEALTQLTFDQDAQVRLSAMQTLSGMGF